MSQPSVDLRYRWCCETFQDGGNGVRVRLSSCGYGSRLVLARYLVACDGAASPIRRALGLASVRDAADARARWQGALVRLPGLRQRTPHAPAVQYYLINPRRMILGSLDGGDLWRVTFPLAGGEDLTAGEVRAIIAGALDCGTGSVEVLDTREWSGDAAVAESFRSGHVLLAGDAAHRMWPSGGHGMNTGLGDVANVGWKIEAVLRGWAPPALLDTYTTERRPTASAWCGGHGAITVPTSPCGPTRPWMTPNRPRSGTRSAGGSSAPASPSGRRSASSSASPTPTRR